MKSSTLIEGLGGLVHESEKSYILNKAMDEANGEANKICLPVKDSRYISPKALQGNLKKREKRYDQVLVQQLQWRYDVLRSGKVLVYDLGKKREKTIGRKTATVDTFQRN